MIIKNVSQIGQPIIRSKSKRIINVQAVRVKKTIRDLVDSMRHHNLVGMAASQIGANQRIFVTELRKTKVRKNLKELDSLRVFINPKIIQRSARQVSGYEGCGSVAIAQLFGSVRRPVQVTIQAINADGQEFTLEAKGLLARVIQHEIDHLDGKVFLDRMTDMASLLDRDSYLAKSRKK